MSDHRWSGWPGAWCLDCGYEDQSEVCMANCDKRPCEKHGNGQCHSPGARKYDPYSAIPEAK